MANKFFTVHNGLVVGPATIDATTGNIATNSTTTSNSTTTGALTVAGGMGIGGNLYVGGELVAQKLTIQFTTVTTTLIETDDIIRTVNTTQSTSTTTGALQVSGGAGIGGNLYVGGTIVGTVTNIAGGAQGSIPIQSAAGTTAFIPIGANGTLLQSNGTTATWVSTGSLVASIANSSTMVATAAQTANAVYFPVFVDSNNATATFENLHTTSTFAINPATGNVGIGVANPGTILDVNGTTRSGNFRVNSGGSVAGSGIWGNDTALAFNTNSSERMRIDASGNIGIGTTIPSAQLHLSFTPGASIPALGTGTGAIAIGPATNYGMLVGTISNGNGYIQQQRFDGTTPVYNLLLQPNGGNVGIGLTVPTSRLHVNGTTLLTGVTTVTNTTTSTSTVTGALIVNGGIGVGNNVYIAGSLFATSKSFLIDHPTKPGKKLRYGSLEGPENGIYIRGRTTDSVIELPEYWTKLVDPESVTVTLTPIGRSRMPSINRVENNRIYLNKPWFSKIDCYYIVFAERADIEKLEPEI